MCTLPVHTQNLVATQSRNQHSSGFAIETAAFPASFPPLRKSPHKASFLNFAGGVTQRDQTRAQERDTGGCGSWRED